MSQIIRLVRDGIGQIWWEIWTGTYCFAGWILSLNPSKWKSCNVYSLCVAASWGGRYLCFKSQQNDWSLHTHTLVFIPLRYKSPPLFRCFLLTFLLKWTKWCSRCVVGGGVVCLRMWGGEALCSGFPFTLYRNLACLSKWLIKMSYYQSHARDFS